MAVARGRPPRPSLLDSLVAFFEGEIEPLLGSVGSPAELRVALARLETRYLHFRRTLLEVVAREANAEGSGATEQHGPMAAFLAAYDGPSVDQVLGEWAEKVRLQFRQIVRLSSNFIEIAARLDEGLVGELFDKAVRVDLLASLIMVAIARGEPVAPSAQRAIVLELENELSRWSRLTAIYRERSREAAPRTAWPELSDERIRESQACADEGLAEWAASIEADAR